MPQQARSGRYPLEAKAVGVLQHGRLKINIFSILWSDQNDIMIYRKFGEFKKLDRELRRKFPLESGLFRKSDNMIPKLRDVPLFRLNRNTSRFMARLRLLENYSRDLLNTDSKVSQSEVVTSFFTPTSSDLNPSFPKNSLMIMPSDVREQQKREQPRQLPKAPASEPIVSQMYVCIEDYETKDTKNRPFKIRRNEHLGVLIKENSGWWLVENEEKHVAWFPAPFLRALEMRDDTDSGTDSDDEGILYYTAMAYEAMSTDEVSITKGVLVEVIEKSNNGWWLIRYNGKTGFVPAMYLKPYRNSHQLQLLMNPGHSPNASNLYKASSTMELSSSIGTWRDDAEHRVPDTGGYENKNKLDRKKSRSICGLPSTNQYGFQAALPELKPREVADSSATEWTPKLLKIEATRAPSSTADALPPTQNLPMALPRKQSSVAGLDVDESVSSRTKAPTKYPHLHLAQETPQIPKRPKQHEILHKCTTVTKRALQTKEAVALPV